MSKADDLFGKIVYRNLPGGRIAITNKWAEENLTTLSLAPYLPTPSNILVGGTSNIWNGRLQFHAKALYQLKAAFAELQQKDLTKHIITFDGSFVPRHMCWDPDLPISIHSYGGAFDINARWNSYGATPPAEGTRGSVRTLVPVFEKWGFTWGGVFRTPDGMHFEVNRFLLPQHTINPEKAQEFLAGIRGLYDLVPEMDLDDLAKTNILRGLNGVRNTEPLTGITYKG